MFQQLVSHNEDIKLLVDKGYAIAFDNSYLVVRDIPYLDENKNLQVGAIVSKLKFIDQVRVQLEDHQIFFCGSHPCQLDGSPIPNLGGGSTTLNLASPDLVVQRSFSNKPAQNFNNNFEKIESYMSMFSGPAMELYPDTNPFTFRSSEEITDSVFKFHDTLTSRAEIGDLNINFKEDIIAIIGLGGTGAYILDFLVKTPVKEIRAFDLDKFHIHNAYRSPGKQESNEFDKSKAEVYQNRYEGFRSGLNFQSKYVLADSNEDLKGATFAFVCVDKGLSRKAIFDLLIGMNIPFIDVGMGLNRINGPINGMMRTTYYATESAHKTLAKRLAPMSEDQDAIYQNNIQIAELNALNASLAVIQYKQIRGFYENDTNINHMLLNIKDLHLVVE
ncbi:MAG: ThiF family adenylyltransferase [Saprospiraceae bacterium]|nr:ThiF family adenylyltransferase [Saprospiraceae bacterium]